MPLSKAAPAPYNPLYFLAALGAGGLAVSFFMYIMWMTPHAGQPIPSFTTLDRGLPDRFARDPVDHHPSPFVGIALFSGRLHVRYARSGTSPASMNGRSTEAAEKLRAGNAETQLMAIPLTLAMSVNVGFIIGAVFVPGLWEIAEFLFPASPCSPSPLIGVYAMRLFADFMGRVLVDGGFHCANNNSLATMLSVFAFAMIGVGFSAGAAMSHNHVHLRGRLPRRQLLPRCRRPVRDAIFLVMGFRSMMEHRANPETVPDAVDHHPLHHRGRHRRLPPEDGARSQLRRRVGWPVRSSPCSLYCSRSSWFSASSATSVMKRARYFEQYVSGEKNSSGARTP